jgi:phosphoenolpyruvate---glycerone phosphotransferase subunit DhaL
MVITREDVLEWIRAYAAVIADNREYLIELDAAIGDADHGANLDRGFKAVLAKLPELADKDIGTILKTIGMTLVSTIGGASGPLYGTFFLQAGLKTAGKLELSLPDWVEALEAAVLGVTARGKAEPGDKTMLDALVPALHSLAKSQADNTAAAQALSNSAEAARLGMEATRPMLARKGRASYLGERSVGHQDPGATSSYLLIQAAADIWADK